MEALDQRGVCGRRGIGQVLALLGVQGEVVELDGFWVLWNVVAAERIHLFPGRGDDEAMALGTQALLLVGLGE